MTTQLDLFAEAEVSVEKPVPRTIVRLGRREARIPLRKQRREALAKLLKILAELEGKDIFIGSYHPGGSHFWLDNLKLPRLKLDWYPPGRGTEDYIPTVLVLWGSRSAQVRKFTDYLVDVREQEYQGYWHWLLDFRNGFWESPIDNLKSHYACLTITRFKD
ncbi:hypothetical protein LCGC14_2459410 [marine sediment metagenome]|uniref:Uncharacterized protein n=1 Tax=marine sediment metagenome TaxID=412755 RepID=A0A0F9BDM5_9ZZZZ